jgi:cytoskeleton protein RodZ
VSDPISADPATTASAAGNAGAAGAALLGERRRQGLSVGDISRQLKLSVRQVEALERDDYSGYKSPVFVHGFIRNYAKLLGLDPEPLIRAADSILHPPQVVEVAPQQVQRPRPDAGHSKRRRVWPALLTVILLVVSVSVYLAGRRAPDAQRSAPIMAAREKADATPKVPAATKADADKKARVESRPGGEAAAPKPAQKSVPSPAGLQSEAPATAGTRGMPVEGGGTVAPESAVRVTVRMIFAQDSWVEIKDRNGNTIFGQLNVAGSRRSVSGEPPLSVVIGNAAGVQLFQGDKSIDLEPHTRVDVARLTLE